MTLVIGPSGHVRAIYAEEIPVQALGMTTITRASHVEPDRDGRWHADFSPLHGPLLGPFANRSEALTAEVAWLERHWLVPTD
jgi:hypothetical protein